MKKVEQNLMERFLAGDVAAASRMISLAENQDAAWGPLFDRVAGKIGQGFRTGLTGPPGAGKSTLLDALTKKLREKQRKVGIVAVDPTSPFSGGALLGDRIRMRRVQLDPDVYIRSMATRGSLGGISRAAEDACDVLDAFGFQELLIETVGVGQAETDILYAVDTVIVILCPGLGDGIQAMKSGLMEIADIFVINKADLAGADKLKLQLRDALGLRDPKSSWQIPIVETQAIEGRGLDELFATIEEHRKFLQSQGALAEARRRRLLTRVQRTVNDGLHETVWQAKGYAHYVAQALQKSKQLAPYTLANSVLQKISAPIPEATVEAL